MPSFKSVWGNFITFARYIKPKCLIGHSTAGFASFLDIVVDWKEGVHEVEHFLEVLKPLGIDADSKDLRPHIHTEKPDHRKVDQWIHKYNLKQFILIHPSAGDPKKLIDPFLWKKLIEKSNFPIVICGSKEDAHWYDKLLLPEKNMIDLIGKTSLQQFFLLCAKASKIYTLDSISGHLAGLSQTPATVFFHRSNHPSQWRPLGKNVTVVEDIDAFFKKC